MGLSTILYSTACRTSTTLPGGAIEASLVARSRVEGNRKLPITAISAAQKVPIRYRIMIGFMLVFCPCLWLAIEEATRMKTRIGATDFNALTNRFPNSPTA